MNPTYSRVIDLLADDSVDYKALVVKLAKVDPEMLLSLVDDMDVGRHMAWATPLLEFITNNDIPSAVRALRAHTKWPLKESVDVISHLQFHLHDNCLAGPPSRSLVPVAGEYDAMLNKLIALADITYNL